jgi:hypothetical protein
MNDAYAAQVIEQLKQTNTELSETKNALRTIVAAMTVLTGKTAPSPGPKQHP